MFGRPPNPILMDIPVRALGYLLDMVQAHLLLQQPVLANTAKIITDVVLVNLCLMYGMNDLVPTMVATDVPLLGSPCPFVACHSPANRIIVFILSCRRSACGKLY